MAIEKQEITLESQIGLTKQRSSQTNDELCFLVPPTFKSFGSPSSSTYAIIIDDEETLEPKNKKTDNLDSPTFNSLVSLPSTDGIIIINEEETLEPKKKKPRLGSWWDYVESINELSSVIKGLPKARVDSCFSSTDLHEKKTKKKKDDERSSSSLSSNHDDNFIDLREDEIVGSSNKGYRHVTLEELGVTVEDLKSMPWELFDPTWEIRSETMDPWLGGYIKDIISPDLF